MATEKRLIDANELARTIRDRTTGSGDNFDIIMTHLYRIVEAVPTVDAVEVVHGRVVTNTDRWNTFHQNCSVCGEEFSWKAYPNYCPNCGADMR